jgi:hypothetical protein
MEARNGGRPYVKKPMTGIMPKATKATSSNSSNKGNNQANNNNKKGVANASNGGKKKGPGLHANGNEKSEKIEGNGSLKKSKEALHTIEKAAVVPDKKEVEQEEEEDLACLICCEPIDFYSAGECEHRFVCSQCTLRRRALYKEWHCCICKSWTK